MGGNDLQPQPTEDLAAALAMGAEKPELKALRREIVSIFTRLCNLPKCPMLAGLYNLAEAL